MAKGRNRKPASEPKITTPTEGGSGVVPNRLRYIGPPEIGKFLLPDNTMIRKTAPDEDIRTAIAKYPDLIQYFAEEEE